jgi:hypothetical protein
MVQPRRFFRQSARRVRVGPGGRLGPWLPKLVRGRLEGLRKEHSQIGPE